MEKKYNVLVIGAGNIGALFDSQETKDVLTHAHAFSKLEEFNLLGFVDSSYEKAMEAAQKWNVQAFHSIEEAFSKYSIDIVSVCVPDEFHYDTMKKLSEYKVKLIFLEKPITKKLDEAKKLVSIYKKNGTPILVNYSRRFVSEFSEVKSKFECGEYGRFLCGSAYYGKGIVHNGSHLIDFLRYVLGEIADTRIFRTETDFYKDDPTVTGAIEFTNGGTLAINGVNCNSYTIFEIDIMFEKCRVRIVNSGFNMETYEVGASEKFNGYKNLKLRLEIETDLGLAIENAAMNIYNYLEKGEALKCTLEDAYRTMEICEHLRGEKFE